MGSRVDGIWEEEALPPHSIGKNQSQVRFSPNQISCEMPHPIVANWREGLWCLHPLFQQRSPRKDAGTRRRGAATLLEPLQQGQERRKMQSAFGKLQENPVVSMCSNRIYCAIIYLFKDVNITLCLIEKMGS